MAVGTVLKAAREQRGWSQRELARQSGVSVSYISMLERGERNRVSADILQQIARVLGLTIDALLSDVDAGPDISKPPLELWAALHWPEKLTREMTEDWLDYSEAERLEFVRDAQALYAQQQAIQAKAQRKRPPAKSNTPGVATAP